MSELVFTKHKQAYILIAQDYDIFNVILMGYIHL